MIAAHHLLLLYLLPAAALVFVTDMPRCRVKQISLISSKLVANGRALEERIRKAQDANRSKKT